jgi:hypothetical protein
MLKVAIIGLGTVSNVHRQAIQETHNGKMIDLIKESKIGMY